MEPNTQDARANIPVLTTTPIHRELFDRLRYLGIIDDTGVRGRNEGRSKYTDGSHLITPWTIWLDYPQLTSWDDDIIKRVLREKEDEGYTPKEQRRLDYLKIIHDCQERIRQLDIEIEQERRLRDE